LKLGTGGFDFGTSYWFAGLAPKERMEPNVWSTPMRARPEFREIMILQRYMQTQIGNALRERYEPALDLPADLRRLVEQIHEQQE
jgi:hypothetical protein